MKKVAGIDYSMMCPCITIGYDTNDKFVSTKSYYLISNKKYCGTFNNITGIYYDPHKIQVKRYDYISSWALSLLKDCDTVSLEDYSMHSKGKVFHIAENTGLLKYKLFQNNIFPVLVSPKSLKKYATGNGNSDKQKMYESFLSDSKYDLKNLFNYKGEKIGNPISDIVDSYYLFKYVQKITE